MEQPLIQISNLSKAYKMGKLESTVLDDVSLTISSGEYVSICGPSGCGKSSLLSIMGLLSGSSKGSYLFDGEDVTKLKQNQLAKMRNRDIGFIFQAFNLSQDMTVEENIELPLTYRKEMKRKERAEAVQNIMEKMYLADFRKYFPGQLSGGQQQRVAIARALAGKPRVILADEPTGNLDSKSASVVMEILNRMNDEGTTICLVTHDPRSAAYANRKIHLFDGKIIQDPNNNSANDEAKDGIRDEKLV